MHGAREWFGREDLYRILSQLFVFRIGLSDKRFALFDPMLRPP
jgi:hypothetical protein